MVNRKEQLPVKVSFWMFNKNWNLCLIQWLLLWYFAWRPCAAPHCARGMRSPLLHPQCSQQKRRKEGKRSPKPSKWLTGETERETALALKRFETLLSHQARLITKKIDLYEGRGSSMHFVLLSGLLDRFLLRDLVWRGFWWGRGMMLMWRKCVRPFRFF